MVRKSGEGASERGEQLDIRMAQSTWLGSEHAFETPEDWAIPDDKVRARRSVKHYPL